MFLSVRTFIAQRTSLLILVFIFVALLIFRFYQIEERNDFNWDQVDNAWIAKNIIVDHKFPLLGMTVKQNTNFSVGPLYYYLITPFYWLFHLDPIASGVFAGVTSIFTFFVIFYITKKLFTTDVALLSVLIYTFSNFILENDRYQWPVNLIPPISFILFYALYNIMLGKEKYLLLFATFLGISFHIHFTAIFFPIITLFTIPFFPKNKKIIKYFIIGLPLFLVWLVPHVIAQLHKDQSTQALHYGQTYFHGIHKVRILQIAKDAFIEFGAIFAVKSLSFTKYFFLPLFILVYIFFEKSKTLKERYTFCYLCLLWFLVPWVVISSYSGEISNYYFSLTRPIVIVIFAYFLAKMLTSQYVFAKIIVLFFLGYYLAFNSYKFFIKEPRGLGFHRKIVIQAIKEGRVIEFTQGVPESYLYYLYKELWKKN